MSRQRRGGGFFIYLSMSKNEGNFDQIRLFGLDFVVGPGEESNNDGFKRKGGGVFGWWSPLS